MSLLVASTSAGLAKGFAAVWVALELDAPLELAVSFLVFINVYTTRPASKMATITAMAITNVGLPAFLGCAGGDGGIASGLLVLLGGVVAASEVMGTACSGVALGLVSEASAAVGDSSTGSVAGGVE